MSELLPRGFRTWRAEAKAEALLYLRHVRGLVIPGVAVAVAPAPEIKPGHLDEWKEEDLLLLVEEGRRQLDRQAARFDRIRTSAQFLFTTALALLVVLAAAARTEEHLLLKFAWGFGLTAVTLGLLGAAAVLTVRSDFGSINAALFSQCKPDRPLLDLATAYSQQVGIGEKTVAARLTVYRDAVWLVLLGALAQLVLWLVQVW